MEPTTEIIQLLRRIEHALYGVERALTRLGPQQKTETAPTVQLELPNLIETVVQGGQIDATIVNASPIAVEVTNTIDLGTVDATIVNPIPVPVQVSGPVATSAQITDPIPLPIVFGIGSLQYQPISLTNSGDVIPGIANKQVRVYAVLVIAQDTVKIQFRSGTTPLTGELALTASSGIAWSAFYPLFVCAPGEPFFLGMDLPRDVGGCVVYDRIDSV